MTEQEPSSSRISNTQNSDSRQCWVCLAAEDDDPQLAFIRPCRCKGTTKYVHVQCLQRWIDEKQKGNSMLQVHCSQCKSTYIIVYPEPGPLLFLLEKADLAFGKFCPFATAGIILGTVYWSAVTYGAVTIMQVLGYKEAMLLMETAEPLLLLVGLPSIPVVLIASQMIRWEEFTLRTLQQAFPRRLHHPVRPSLLGANDIPAPAEPQHPIARDAASATRVFVSALALPTIATLCGRLLFGGVVRSPLKRALLGGAVYILVKGVLNVYYQQRQQTRRMQRSIDPYTGDERAAVESVQQQQRDEEEEDIYDDNLLMNAPSDEDSGDDG